MKITCRFLSLVVALVLFSALSDLRATTIAWTTSLTNSTNVINPAGSVGDPTGRSGFTTVEAGGSATWTAFSTTAAYSTSGLAALLGINVSNLSVPSILIVEDNTPNLPFENSTLTISDGISNLVIPHLQSNPGATPNLIAHGQIPGVDFNTFFSSSFGTMEFGAFLLIDVSSLDTSQSAFSITLTTDSGMGVQEPDPIAVGLIVPEASSILLLGCGVLGLALRRKR